MCLSVSEWREQYSRRPLFSRMCGGFDRMIRVNRLNDTEFWVSADQIEFLEETPDTVISLVSGRKIVVTQSIGEILEQIIEYRRRIAYVPDVGRNESGRLL